MAESRWPDKFYTYVIFTSKPVSDGKLKDIASIIQPEEKPVCPDHFFNVVASALPTAIADFRPESLRKAVVTFEEEK